MKPGQQLIAVDFVLLPSYTSVQIIFKSKQEKNGPKCLTVLLLVAIKAQQVEKRRSRGAAVDKS